MLQPKKFKFRKSFRRRGHQFGKAMRGTRLAFGAFGIKTTQSGEITSRQIEASRKAIVRYLKRGGKIWIRIFPQMPITRKAAEVPMGSGKGAVDFFVAPVKAGTVLFELDGIPQEAAKSALQLAAAKLPVKTRFITHEIV